MGTIFLFNIIIYYCYNMVSFSHVNILILLFVLMLLSFLVLFSQGLIHLPRAALPKSTARCACMPTSKQRR